MHLWVRLDDGVDELALAARAAKANVLVSAGRLWFPAEATGSYLRLSYACASEAALARGLETLARVVGSSRGPSSRVVRTRRG